MKKETGRRFFFKKAFALTSVTVLASKFGFALNLKPAEPKLKNISALGFQWKTKDPFLFCVHHEDAYPK